MAQNGRGRPRLDLDAAVRSAVVDLVRTHGYVGTSIDQIAARAGTAKTTLYRRWGSKSALTLAVLIHTLGEPPLVEDSPQDGVRTAVEWLAQRIADPDVHPLMTALVGEASRDPATRQAFRTALREPFESRIVAAWSLDPTLVDVALDITVGALLHRAAMNGTVDETALEAIVAVAVSFVSPQP